MTRILILYLLLEGARSGYELKRIVSRPFVRFWFRIEDASIYSSLKTLARRGLAKTSHADRAVHYDITRDGVAHYEALCEEAWGGENALNFQAALAVCSGVSHAKLARLFRNRRHLMVERGKQLETLKLGALSEPLARREHRLIKAEVAWLDDELRRLGK